MFQTTSDIIEALRATSAAPTYFKRQDIDQKTYVDGGLGANCPAAKGLQLGMYYWNQGLLSHELNDTEDLANEIFNNSIRMRKTEFVLSLGTGATKAKELKGRL